MLARGNTWIKIATHIVIAGDIKRQRSSEGDQKQCDNGNEGAGGYRRHSVEREVHDTGFAKKSSMYTFIVFKPEREAFGFHAPPERT